MHILHYYGKKMSTLLTALYGFIAEVQKDAVLSLLNVKLGSFVEVKSPKGSVNPKHMGKFFFPLSSALATQFLTNLNKMSNVHPFSNTTQLLDECCSLCQLS